MEWILAWGDHTWSEDDLTGAHLVIICQSLGRDSWDVAKPAGPIWTITYLAAFLTLAEIRTFEDVLTELGAASANQLAEALSFVES